MRRWLPLALLLAASLASPAVTGSASIPHYRTVLAALVAAFGVYLFTIPPPAQAIVQSDGAASGDGTSPAIPPRRPMLQWLYAQRHSALFGTSTGLSGFALGEFLRKVDWTSFLGFAGSALAALTNWWLSRRAELSRQKNELRRDERQAARDEAQVRRDDEMTALLRAIQKHRSHSGQAPGEAACVELPKSSPGSPSPASSPSVP